MKQQTFRIIALVVVFQIQIFANSSFGYVAPEISNNMERIATGYRFRKNMIGVDISGSYYLDKFKPTRTFSSDVNLLFYPVQKGVYVGIGTGLIWMYKQKITTKYTSTQISGRLPSPFYYWGVLGYEFRTKNNRPLFVQGWGTPIGTYGIQCGIGF